MAIEKPSDRYRSSVPPRLARDSLPDLAAEVDERLLHNDKMSSLGQLIAGIAQNAAETQNREMAALAQQMAKDALAQFGVKS